MVLRWTLGVMKLRLLIRRWLVRKLRKLIKENVALRKLIFQSS